MDKRKNSLMIIYKTAKEKQLQTRTYAYKHKLTAINELIAYTNIIGDKLEEIISLNYVM